MPTDSSLVPGGGDDTFQLPIDVDAHGSGPGTGVTLSLGLFLAGLVATLLFLRAGVGFFFLPIVLPFGLGGGSALGRALRQVQRRVLRVRRGQLSLMTAGPFGARLKRTLDVSAGVHASLQSVGVWSGSVERCALRLVSRKGALMVRLSSVEHGRLLRGRLGPFLHEAGVEALGGDEPLAGGVTILEADGRREVAWRSPSSQPGLPLVVAFAMPLGFLALFIALTALAPAAWLPAFAIAAAVLVVLSVLGLMRRRSHRTVLRLGMDAWDLRVLSGRSVVASTGGPGKLSARLVERKGLDPLGSGLSLATRALELDAGREIVGVVGDGLSDPELRFVMQQL